MGGVDIQKNAYQIDWEWLKYHKMT